MTVRDMLTALQLCSPGYLLQWERARPRLSISIFGGTMGYQYQVLGVEVLAQSFGVDRMEELAQAIIDASNAQIHSAAADLDGYREHMIPDRRPGELRPFLGQDALWPWGDMDLGSETLEKAHAAAEQILIRIQHELLYTHSVATLDPYENVVRPAGGTDVIRRRLITYAVVMTYLYPLIQSGCVVFAEHEALYYECPKNPPECNWRSLNKKRKRSLLSHGSDLQQTKARIDRLVHELWRIGMLAKRVDVRLARPDDRDLLAWIFDPEQEAVIPSRIVGPESVRDDELLVLRNLVDLPLPGVGRLTPRDLVDIRQEETFERWRHAIRTGVVASNALPSLLNPEAGMMESIRREVQYEATTLYQSFGRSKYLSDRTDGVRELGVETIIGAGTGSPVSAIAISAATSVGKIIWSAGGNRDAPSERAFRHHVEAILES